MNKQRLLRLARLLDKDAKKKKGIKFDLGTWATNLKDGELEFPTPQKFKKLDCNTSACAVGLACISGEFKKDGLRWRSDEFDNNIVPMFRGDEQWDAVKRFFGISSDEANNLFAITHYPRALSRGADGERAVAQRIRELVARS